MGPEPAERTGGQKGVDQSVHKVWAMSCLEAPSGFEPLHKGFADLSLSHLGTAPHAWDQGSSFRSAPGWRIDSSFCSRCYSRDFRSASTATGDLHHCRTIPMEGFTACSAGLCC